MDQETRFQALKKPSLQIIFSYSPTGFGHLRVMDALQHGLPPNIESETFGADDTSLGSFYRLISVYPPLRVIYERLQGGWIERPFTAFYRWILRTRPVFLYIKLKTLINKKKKSVTEILFVATHFGLAHKLGAIKKQLEEETGVKIILVVVVTDDSPQLIWYVREADFTVVPSEYTKTNLQEYEKKFNKGESKIEINPYPISPTFSTPLPEKQYETRIAQTQPENPEKAQIAIPISGAAVGTNFALKFMKRLQSFSDKYEFHIIAKEAPYTLYFLHTVSGMPGVDLHSSYIDRRTVDLYEEMYEKEIITYEVTKPSEQAFKALLQPSQRAGSILLFVKPVGRQEYDNLNFLERHFLIPTKENHRHLYSLAEKKAVLRDDKQGSVLMLESARWRGVILPTMPEKAAEFVQWGAEQGLFKSMMTCCVEPSNKDVEKKEINPHGVQLFWEKVEDLIQSKTDAK